VCLLATQGTYSLGFYQAALATCGIDCHLPTEPEREQVMRGIRDGVKAGDLELATRLFSEVARRMVERHRCEDLLLACTEIPLALHSLPGSAGARLVDPADVLARALAGRAYAAG
jgi:aspartate racemase